ncbi:secreted protein containing DUF1549 [Rhodopirellula maiorica SM1]|uniref:Secreted protein containing DUF1549 n=1 Tax=Rhodopirellula maiorica SM1 TaxID=1265738 RepID=M5RNZ1_9BACT|nr:PSD1 and planctomycete cytochrome C domain-containing protein [Rhodopirellula maiorica]EMI21015.1 secreted protein containing DUF1549 [Rhodopirellula maiorica SM1]
MMCIAVVCRPVIRSRPKTALFDGFRVLFAAACCSLIFSSSAEAGSIDDYQTKIKPLFKTRCFSCHGALKQEGGLRLDTAELMIDGGVVTRGDVSDSVLIDRVSETTVEDRMPPEHEGEALSKAEIELLAAWIAAGAPAPEDEQPETDPEDHWSFQPIVRPLVPAVENASWIRNPIDSFIATAHQQNGLTPQPEAPRAILVRRLYLDLIGIPPTSEEIAAAEQDTASDWYEQIVQRLLDDPRHGERWARHWMDIWRYSDWWGLNAQLRNSQRHLWHWRDWIVDSLNADRGYDEMVRQMLAGDELHPNDMDALVATGYLARNFFLFNRNQWMDETVEHVGKAFLGLTFDCAKCHDHKFDPIQHADFYKMRAFFEPYQVRMDMVPGEVNLTRDGIPRAFDALLDTPTYRLIRGEEGNPDKSKVIEPGIPDFLDFGTAADNPLEIRPIELPAEAWQPQRRSWVFENHLAAAKAKQKSAESKLKQAEKAKQKAKQKAGEDNAAAEYVLQLARMDVDIAQAECESVSLRYKAMQTQWAESPDEAAVAETKAAAIRAERQVSLLQAKRSLLDVDKRLAAAAEDKREAIEKEKSKAQDKVDKAEQTLAAAILPNDSFTPLIGAQWSATRFLSTGRDDPAIAFPPKSSGRRSALARWITDRNHPLTARVAANHLWTRHLGQPLVATVFDLGRNGAKPSNAALLDWLAVELIDSGYSMKHLHRLIVNSAVYRMSSSNAGAESNLAIDPDNHLWWRRVPIRLESQVVRDAVLSLAGTLDPTMGGPPVPPAKQPDSKRRSLYFFHSNNERDLFLTMFDEARVTDCYRREPSIVPQQALALTNSKLVLTAAGQIAQRLSVEGEDTREFVVRSFKTLLSIDADDAEIAASLKALSVWEGQADSSEERARAHFIWVLVNHNDFVTVR